MRFLISFTSLRRTTEKKGSVTSMPIIKYLVPSIRSNSEAFLTCCSPLNKFQFSIGVSTERTKRCHSSEKLTFSDLK
uniref:Uncharacterized protein n=1 Tax=Mus musculus TaxID=10090 RepID=Q3TZY7_MOUSE|nr:unnamed protein product [Mus musculus]